MKVPVVRILNLTLQSLMYHRGLWQEIVRPELLLPFTL